MRWILCSVLAIIATTTPPAWAQPSPELLAQHRARPDDWKLCHQIALAYTQAQNLNLAEEFYRKTLKLKADFIPARKNLATVCWFLGKRTESEALFRALLPVVPNDPVPHLYLAMAESGRKRFTAAKEHFSKAGDLAMRNPEVLPSVVEAFLAAKDQSIVPRALSVLPELEGIDSSLRTKVAVIFNRYGSWPASIEALQNIRSPDLETMLLLAEAYDRQNLPERSHEAYAKAMESNPLDERSYIALAAFASGHHNAAYALKVLEKGMLQIPGSWRLHLHGGLLLAMEGDRAGAERHFEKAIEQGHGATVPLLALGVLKLESGRAQEAVSIFERAARSQPKDPNSHYFHALALYRQGEKASRAQAEASVRTALKIEPDDVKSRVLLGQILASAAQLTAACNELESALKLDPDNAAALYQLSLALRRQGRTAEADRYMTQFRTLKAETRKNETELVQILKIVR